MIRPASKRTSFEQFAVAHGDGLVRLAFTICGDRGRAEDAGQEALVRVYQRWSRLRDPLPYARRVAVNATREDWRRSMREHRARAKVGAQLGRDVSEDPYERLVVREALMTALAELPHGQRVVIALRYGSQLSEAETAATLEISIGTVKSQTARGLTRLRELLGREPAIPDMENT